MWLTLTAEICQYCPNVTFFFSDTVPPNILDIESTPSSVAVRENQNINMTCRAEGFPNPKIIWRREDGQTITVERKRKGKSFVPFCVINLIKMQTISINYQKHLDNNIRDTFWRVGVKLFHLKVCFEKIYFGDKPLFSDSNN